MNQILFQIIDNKGIGEAESQIVIQCAPVLMQLKVSNLMMVDRKCKDTVVDFFQKEGLSIHILKETNKKVTMLVYRYHLLRFFLEKDEIREMLHQFGYQVFDVEYVLCQFAERYLVYIKNQGEFPHEMGLLLGYPIEDVIGFIEHAGQDYLYVGYWKVYSNLNKALDIFESYNKAQEYLIEKLSQGHSLSNILREHERSNRRFAVA